MAASAFGPRKTTTSYNNDQSAGGGVATMAPPRKSAAAPTHDQIAARAREIWQRNGRQAGRDQENWLEAERQLRAELKAAQR
jgi:hypothetical protein